MIYVRFKVFYILSQLYNFCHFERNAMEWRNLFLNCFFPDNPIVVILANEESLYKIFPLSCAALKMTEGCA